MKTNVVGKKLRAVICAVLACWLAAPSLGVGEEWACVRVFKIDAGGGTYLYQVEPDFGKDGASSGSFQTPRGTYSLSYYALGDMWEPGPGYDDDESLSFADLQAVLGTPWTVNWSSTPATATLTFPVPSEGDWLAEPTLTSPIPGAIFPENSTVGMNWTWPGDTNDVDEVILLAESEEVDHWGVLPPPATSWTTPALAPGAWELLVTYPTPDQGLAVNTTVGTWDTAGSARTGVFYCSEDEVEITVLPEPATLALLGLAVPALLRRRR